MVSPSSQTELLETPLNALHRELGARMVDFAGWDMPVQYPIGILAEHQAVRNGCGLFDLSHMGRVYVRGRGAVALSQQCCARDLSKIRAGEAAYSVLCDENGGILDDVIAYVIHGREVVFVFNASNRVSDSEWFAEQRDRLGLEAEIADRTLETALIGVQGPQAQEVLGALCSEDLEPLPGYAFTEAQVAGVPAFVSRTGYTGEDGFEVLVQASVAAHVWTRLMERAPPCGLGARDTLRTEAGFALYGHEIDRSTNPYEARLGWVVSLGKPEFVGREALARIKAEGSSRRLVGLVVEPGGVPRPGCAIVSDGRRIGEVTSGTFSPTLRQNIAMGYVPTNMSEPGGRVGVELRGKAASAEIVKLPFVQHKSRPRAKM
jgi:aminomethyltransferase